VIAKFKEQPRLNSALAALCLALVVLAYLAIGPASQSSGQATRTATVQRGVVQSSVSGSGNVQAASQLNLGFKTSGTVTHIYVKSGQHVTQGQLLATLDPQSAEVVLQQAKASLQSAEANLAKQEEGGGETSATQASSATGASATAATSASGVLYATNSPVATATTTAPATTTPASPTKPAGTTTTKTTTTKTTTSTGTKTSPAASVPTKSTTTSSPSPSTSAGGSTSGAQGTSSSGSTQSAATLEANLASARATVKSDQRTVKSDEKAVSNTKLYAPENGTIVAFSGEVGETVSGTGTTKASSASGTSSTGATGAAGSTAGGSSGGASSSSSSSSASSATPFAVLSNLESMQLVVPLSESEIGSVKVGQIAAVTVEALSGRKVAAHVLSIDQLPTTTSGVVSYDVAFQLDQGASGVKTGMSATAEVVVKQEEGLNVPSSAISAGSVTVLRGGKHVTQPVTTGLVGNSSTIILSGVKSGEEVVLPTVTTTASGTATRARTGAIGGGIGGGGIGGGGFAGGGLAGGAAPGGKGGG
jgi:multidrug efflux pump subunit AcrA (membrane-fusion protein)